MVSNSLEQLQANLNASTIDVVNPKRLQRLLTISYASVLSLILCGCNCGHLISFFCANNFCNTMTKPVLGVSQPMKDFRESLH